MAKTPVANPRYTEPTSSRNSLRLFFSDRWLDNLDEGFPNPRLSVSDTFSGSFNAFRLEDRLNFRQRKDEDELLCFLLPRQTL
jgi:hypothetical protein